MQATINATIAREKSYNRKSYGNVEAANIATTQISESTVGDWNQLKKNIKKSISSQFQNYWPEKIQSLLIQGKFLELLVEEKSDISWKSIIYNLPVKVLSFATRAAIDCLPNFSNFHRWGKRLSTKSIRKRIRGQ